MSSYPFLNIIGTTRVVGSIGTLENVNYPKTLRFSHISGICGPHPRAVAEACLPQGWPWRRRP